MACAPAISQKYPLSSPLKTQMIADQYWLISQFPMSPHLSSSVISSMSLSATQPGVWRESFLSPLIFAFGHEVRLGHLPLCVAVLNQDVSSLNIAEISQPMAERVDPRVGSVGIAT